MAKKVRNKLHIELLMGVILLAVLTGAYVVSRSWRCQTGGQQPADSQVRFLMDETDWKIDDMDAYYSVLAYISYARFLAQQCGMIGDELYCSVAQIQPPYAISPLSIRVQDMQVLDTLDAESLAVAEKAFIKNTGAAADDWRMALSTMSDQELSRETLEQVSQYLVVDVVLTPGTNEPMIMTSSQLNMTLADEHGFIRDGDAWVGKKYRSGSFGAILETDKPIGYVECVITGNGKYIIQQQENEAFANLKGFFVISGQTHLKLLYVVTNEELASGKLALTCRMHQSILHGSFYSNAGYIIRLQRRTEE